MDKAERALRSSALKLLERFHAADLPFTGIAGTHFVDWKLQPEVAVGTWFSGGSSSPSVSLKDSAGLLQRMEAQLGGLQAAEEETLEALSGWAGLLRQWGNAGIQRPFAAAAAIEQGMQLVCQQSQALTDPLQLQSFESDGQEEGEVVSVDSIVSTARQLYPGLFEEQLAGSNNSISSGAGDSGDEIGSSPRQPPVQQQPVVSKSQLSDRLHALTEVMYKHYKLRCPPFEWVYDGLDPLLLPQALAKRKGTPAAMAIAAAAAGRHLGVPLLPLPAAPIEAGAAAGVGGTIPTEHLSDDLALKFANKAQAMPPGPGPWLARLDTTAAAINSGQEAPEIFLEQEEDSLQLDAETGKILSGKQAIDRHPGILGISSVEWQLRSVLTSWQGLARLALQAHQRRGESDFVAHWMYIVLALDPSAAEWKHVFSGPELKRQL